MYHLSTSRVLSTQVFKQTLYQLGTGMRSISCSAREIASRKNSATLFLIFRRGVWWQDYKNSQWVKLLNIQIILRKGPIHMSLLYTVVLLIIESGLYNRSNDLQANTFYIVFVFNWKEKSWRCTAVVLYCQFWGSCSLLVIFYVCACADK